MHNEISWHVIPPKRAAGLGTSRPKATIVIESEGADAEYLHVPASVGRSMERSKRAGEYAHCNETTFRDRLGDVTERVAHEVVCRMLQRRDYSSQEVLNKLNEYGFPKEVATSTVERAVHGGLISNERFMDAFVRGKIAAGWGMERIERELCRRGVDVSQYSGWPYEYLDPEDELSRATDIAAHKRVREPNAFAKLVRFLMGRGFGYAVSVDAARKVLGQS